MGNPYHDRLGRFASKNRAANLVAGLQKYAAGRKQTADQQSDEIRQRWDAMTPEQQKAERRRMVKLIEAPPKVDLGGQDIDKQHAKLDARWDAMTPAEQKAERKRALEATLAPIRRGIAPTVTEAEVDADAARKKARWDAMTPAQQKAERRRSIEILEGNPAEAKPETSIEDGKRRRPTDYWMVDPNTGTAKSTSGATITGVDKVDTKTLSRLYAAEGSRRFEDEYAKADTKTKLAFRLGYRNPRARRRARVDE